MSLPGVYLRITALAEKNEGVYQAPFLWSLRTWRIKRPFFNDESRSTNKR